VHEEVFQRLKDMGASDADAYEVALVESATVGAINSVLETVGFGELILRNREGMNLLQRAVRGYFAEGATEGVQEAVPLLVGMFVEEGSLTPLQAAEWEQVLGGALIG